MMPSEWDQWVFLSFLFQVIMRADPHIGLLHRATEKLIEYKTYLQVYIELKLFNTELWIVPFNSVRLSYAFYN